VVAFGSESFIFSEVECR